ncbi:dehydratase (plasmid) [Fulvitalea axinellae]|uniref:Dehydratase n=1 Tax=Fulvitalea axinellae TaxID=1182444 RepID=A0AAU9D141_9BACT|nr:dehydratase [Fulvitalea axinellae]
MTPHKHKTKRSWRGFRALLSLTRGVPATYQDYSDESFSENVALPDHRNLSKHFGLTPKAIPLPFWYISAQETHIELMFRKRFPYPLAGTVHVENSLEKITEFNPEKPVNVRTTVFCEAKPEGSPTGTFVTEFEQEGEVFVRNESVYLWKKGGKKSKKKKSEPEIFEADWSKISDINPTEGQVYARLSGDQNPIHTSSLIAKVFGFKSKIIHGWNLVYRLYATALENGPEPKRFTVRFHKPVGFPGKVMIEGKRIEPSSLIIQSLSPDRKVKQVSFEAESNLSDGDKKRFDEIKNHRMRHKTP